MYWEVGALTGATGERAIVYSALDSIRTVVAGVAATVLLFSTAYGKVNTLETVSSTLESPAIRLPAAVVAKPEFTINKRSSGTRTGIDLSATMSAKSGVINRPINWTVYSEIEQSRKWQSIREISNSSPKLDLEPGRYVVRLNYGKVRTSRLIEVTKGMVTEMTVNLNAGGLRMISRIYGQPVNEVTPEHRVYRILKESGSRELVGKTARQGEILRLSAGTYKVVSRFGNANAVQETVARVRPGQLSALEFDHLAGVATLIVPKLEAGDKVHWVVTDAAGSVVAITDERQPSLVLRSGAYRATATINGSGIVENFSLSPGQSVRVRLPGARKSTKPNDS